MPAARLYQVIADYSSGALNQSPPWEGDVGFRTNTGRKSVHRGASV